MIACIIARRLNTKSQSEPPIWRHSTAELAAICSRLGRIPTKAEYMADIGVINEQGAEIYRYMNFDQIQDYKDVADTVAA